MPLSWECELGFDFLVRVVQTASAPKELDSLLGLKPLVVQSLLPTLKTRTARALTVLKN